MAQVWRDLLFAHWAISPGAIRALIPEQLALDTFEGQAWISIAPFRMSVRMRGLPHLPGMSDILELNCRTYVSAGGKPGVYFFSLDTFSRMTVWGARLLFHLPYFHAEMSIEKRGDSISYSSTRKTANWRTEYRPTSAVQKALPGSLDDFLTERYCLYTIWNGRSYRGEIHHLPWPLQQASLTIHENTVAKSAGISLPRTPDSLSFTRELQVLIWPLTPVNR
jgi:uncharacterized protein YqjF (DUF2071 family)